MAGDEDIISVVEGQEVVAEVASATEQHLLDELKSKFERLKSNRSIFVKSRFPKVSKLLGEEVRDSDQYYEPKCISFGPYHHRKFHNKEEEIKLRLVAVYLELFGKTVDVYYHKIKGIVRALKSHYDEECTKIYSDEEFTAMMVVDGCSLLQYIFCVCTGWFREDLKIRYQDLSVLNQDALLLENQLPFQLLFELWPHDPEILEEMCLEFIRMNNRDSFLQETNYNCTAGSLLSFIININLLLQKFRRPIDERNEPYHLLDLFRRTILGVEGSSQTHTEDQILKDVGMLDCSKSVQEAMKGDFLSFRNVKELMASGIRIRCSNSSFLKDISFTSNGITACLSLPPITVDESTKAIFLNLIAYEMCSDAPHDFISYLRFLDSLIDHAEDVKELQSIGVLQNNLGTHEQVAQFFNTVSAKLEPNFHAYRDVRERIRKHLQSHYNSKLKMWITICLDTYFGSPWSIIALVGAIVALFLTGVQAYFSAFPHSN